MTKCTDKAIILAALALAVAALLLAGCSTTAPEGTQFSDPAWIFARGEMNRQTALLERIAAAVEKPREVGTLNPGGGYYIPQWTWPANPPVAPGPRFTLTNGYWIVTNNCINLNVGVVK